MVRTGGDKRYDIVRWAHYAPVLAENLGATQANVDGFAATATSDVKRLPGQAGDLGRALGPENRWRTSPSTGRQLRQYV